MTEISDFISNEPDDSAYVAYRARVLKQVATTFDEKRSREVIEEEFVELREQAKLRAAARLRTLNETAAHLHASRRLKEKEADDFSVSVTHRRDMEAASSARLDREQSRLDLLSRDAVKRSWVALVWSVVLGVSGIVLAIVFHRGESELSTVAAAVAAASGLGGSGLLGTYAVKSRQSTKESTPG